jgi:hypothetical protein
MKRKIEETLLKCGYAKYDFFILDGEDRIKFDFDNTFTNEEKTELYIIIEKDISKEKIKQYEEEILWFQNWYNDNALIYNINLILIYDKNISNEEFSNLIFKYERDTHICRKIFINSDSDIGELNVLPFNPLNEIEFNGQEEELKKNIVSILGNEQIYDELLKPCEELDVDKIRKNLLT